VNSEPEELFFLKEHTLIRVKDNGNGMFKEKVQESNN
jgi:hypothetical protein